MGDLETPTSKVRLWRGSGKQQLFPRFIDCLISYRVQQDGERYPANFAKFIGKCRYSGEQRRVRTPAVQCLDRRRRVVVVDYRHITRDKLAAAKPSQGSK
ncbi:hypothetical protein LSAT2_007966 [Lamellibrachia satsuma]|nr:hypothetical protein LSAT2_007966 [Lamellibrachia satsuma]